VGLTNTPNPIGIAAFEGKHMSDETDDKNWPWAKVDPHIRRTAWITGIVAGLVNIGNFLTPFVTKVPVPSFEVWVVIIQVFFIALDMYKGYTTKGYLSSRLQQHMFISMAIVSFGEVAIFSSRTATQINIPPIGIAWVFVGCGWTALSVFAAHARDHALLNTISILADLQIKTVTTMATMSDNMGKLIDYQGQGIEGDAKQIEIIDQLQSQIAGLEAKLPKPRKPKTVPTPSAG
jgi:hypothetical protein